MNLSSSSTEETEKFCRGPTTRYQGSKRKILPWIWGQLADTGFTSVLDVFGGSATVSYLFKRMGKRVTYNDYMRWNYVIGQALVENDKNILSDEEIGMLTMPVSRSEAGFVTKTFDGVYFTRQENLWIDALVSRIGQIPGCDRCGHQKRAVAQYALFQTCLAKRPFNMFHRANLSIRLADVERTFGNKTTWDKRFPVHFRAFVEEVQSFIIPGAQPCKALNFAAADLPYQQYDLIYLDPPYLKKAGTNESSKYWHCYHFLEGLARYDEWPHIINYSGRLRNISDAGDKAWINPDTNTKAFEELFEKFRDSTVAVSYKKFGTPSISTLVRILKRFGKKVRTHTKHYKYALNQQNGSAQLNRECLIIAE